MFKMLKGDGYEYNYMTHRRVGFRCLEISRAVADEGTRLKSLNAHSIPVPFMRNSFADEW